jgi:hypothetical protein
MVQRDFAVEAVIPLSDKRVCSKATVIPTNLSGTLIQDMGRTNAKSKKVHKVDARLRQVVSCALSHVLWRSVHEVKKELKFLAILPIIGCAA